MRAICLDKYGSLDGWRVAEIPNREPEPGSVRIRVHASALNPADCKVALGQTKLLHGRRFPMALGYDFSGVIEAIGEGTDGFNVGNEVFGFLPYGPFNRQGAFAETLIARTGEIAPKPPGVSHIQAAASATPALSALQGIRNSGKLSTPGGEVLITGVSGGVGSTAISVAKRLGATVIGVGSGRGLDLARELGVHDVIDRKEENGFPSWLGLFDVIFDAAAAYRWKYAKDKLKTNGTYVTTLPSLAFVLDKLASFFSTRGVEFLIVKSRADDLRLVASWLDSGLSIAVDSTIPVRDVARGLERLKNGEVLGRIAVDVIDGF